MATEKYGPYGSSLESDWRNSAWRKSDWSYEVGVCESIKEIVIRHGWVVDGIGFAKLDALGATSSTQYFGGFGGDFERIILKRNEHITRISGRNGKYSNYSDQPLVASLTIHTNLRPTGYGPFGVARGCGNRLTNFSSPFQQTDNLVKLFGKSNSYLLSIGIEVTKVGVTNNNDGSKMH